MQNKRKRLKILFFCNGNSCRSQMAEGRIRKLKGDVDISGQKSKVLDEVKTIPFDFVVTVCGSAHERCPVFTVG